MTLQLADWPVRVGRVEPAPPLYSVPHVVAFTLLWTLAQLLFVLILDPAVLQGAQIDTDGYMRLFRVRLLLEGGGWFDGSIPASNWPFGEVHHWTRPLDVLIIALMLPFRAFLSADAALAVAGAIVSPLCHLALCIAAVWVIRPIVSGEARFLILPVVLTQPGLFVYGTPGRADHHMLIFLLATLALGAWLRALLAPEDRRWAFAAGALSGTGVWVSPESLLPLGLLFVSGCAAWLLRGDRMLGPNIRLCTGLATALIAAIALERPPAAWLEIAFDRISVAHLTMSTVALGFWLAMRWLAAGTTAGRSETMGAASAGAVPIAVRWGRRLAAGTAGTAVAVGMLALVHPRFFRGPWEDVDPEIIGLWLSRVQELQPLWPRTAAGVDVLVLMVSPALLLVPAAAWWLWRDRANPRLPIRVLLLLSALVYTALAIAQRRFAGYMGIVIALLAIELIGRLLEYVDNFQPGPRRAARLGIILGMLSGPIVLAGAVGAALRPWAQNDGPTDAERRAACGLAQLAGGVADPDGLGAEPRTIAAFIDFGPELLYRTPHRVLAGPYHRNHDGILAAYRLFTSADATEAHSIARARELDLMLICPPVDSAYFSRGGEASLYARLIEGREPDWIRRIPLPAGAPEAFRLYEVRPGAGPR